ncbi:MAG: DUF6456 domain-containing protein [Rhizobiaceae bacterium]
MAGKSKESALRREEKATLVHLLKRPKTVQSSQPGKVRLLASDAAMDIDLGTLAALAAMGLVIRSSTNIVLSSAGRELGEQFLQRPDLELSVIVTGGTLSAAVAINTGESPLATLYARKSAGGQPFLTDEEFEAGERLRQDFTRAMLMPRISANWQASVTAGRRAGDSNGVETLTHSALAARLRFEKAVTGLGGDLSGVVTDICCFMKGFEQVELERKWPKRSAKFMLKAALSILALHYWPPSPTTNRPRHWGADGFKPVVGGAS